MSDHLTPEELSVQEIDAAIAEAVAAAKAQIVGWLRAEAVARFNKGLALDYNEVGVVLQANAMLMGGLADAIETGAPERWAAEREGSR